MKRYLEARGRTRLSPRKNRTRIYIEKTGSMDAHYSQIANMSCLPAAPSPPWELAKTPIRSRVARRLDDGDHGGVTGWGTEDDVFGMAFRLVLSGIVSRGGRRDVRGFRREMGAASLW